jgi:hypothetical protein
MLIIINTICTYIFIGLIMGYSIGCIIENIIIFNDKQIK